MMIIIFFNNIEFKIAIINFNFVTNFNIIK